MKRLSTVLFTSLLICLLCAGTRSGYGEELRGVTKDTIKIGVIMDQTGAAASITIPITEATKIYFKDINDKGGINGRKVNLIVEDDHYTIPGAVAAFKKLIFKDAVFSILHCGGTGQTLALMNQIEKNKVPVIPASLAESMAMPLRRHVFLATSSYDDGLKIIVDYIMKDLKAVNPKLAFVYPDIEFGKNGLRSTEIYLTKYNLKLSNQTIINIGDIDATSQILSLKKLDLDYIILHEALAGLISFFKSAKRYGLKTKVIGSFYVSDDDNIPPTGDAMKDVIAVSCLGYWSNTTPGMVHLREVTKKYRPDTKKMTRSYTQGWVISMICAEGLRRAGRNLNTDTLVEAYESIKNFPTGGISGPVNFSKNNHKGGRFNKFYKPDIEGQTWIPISEDREQAFKD